VIHLILTFEIELFLHSSLRKIVENSIKIIPYFENFIIVQAEICRMANGHSIQVFFSSRTVGGLKGREGMAPVCHSCDKALGISQDSETRAMIPSGTMPLVFSAQLASEELGVNLELIDINRLNMVQRIKEKLSGRPIPRVSIGDDFITGCLTKHQIIELYHRVCDNSL
jgi:hypothetical protein